MKKSKRLLKFSEIATALSEWLDTIHESTNASDITKCCEILEKILPLKLITNCNWRHYDHTSVEIILQLTWALENYPVTSPAWISLDEQARNLIKKSKCNVFEHRKLPHFQETLFGTHVYLIWLTNRWKWEVFCLLRKFLPTPCQI